MSCLPLLTTVTYMQALDDEDQQAIEAMVAAKKIKTKQRHPQEDLLDEKENALGANSEENGDYDDFYDLSEMLAKGEADSGMLYT